MIVSIGKGRALGSVAAPPSKSMAHRYLICGALADGVSQIDGIRLSKDIEATLGCLQALGAGVEEQNGTVRIGGLKPKNAPDRAELFCRESGSTLRFLLPLCLLLDRTVRLSGSERLLQRSLSVYEELCRNQGFLFRQDRTSVTVKGRLAPGRYSVRGDVSSQFISGLLFALPLLEADSEIVVTGTLESGSYLRMTVKALADFGIRVQRADERTFLIRGGQTYRPCSMTVEGDYSNAAFLDAFNGLDGHVTVTGLSEQSVQGDRVYRELFSKLASGAPELELSDCPDLAPILIALAAANHGAVFTGTRRLKMKESDRGAAMAEELLKFGCRVDVEENLITVHPCALQTPKVPLSGHNDHRIVMSLSVLCTLTGGTIYGAEAVSKSFPDFFDRLTELGIPIKVEQ